jgi:hypothetical protein
VRIEPEEVLEEDRIAAEGQLKKPVKHALKAGGNG